MRYNPAKIEPKWQKYWVRNRTYEPDLRRAKYPLYNLMMFPYPSAEGLHIGAVRTFSGVDIYGRFKRMRGRDVFEPIGLDGFGIHSENYALKIGKHPVKHAKHSQKNFYRQLSMMGNGFAWNERLETYDPAYYKWTQWIFVQMFKKGLAYRKKAKVNWCPSCKTVLADEQVIVGECERCSAEVIKKDLEQWFFKITDYAERLLQNIGKLDWSEKVKIAQRNWIGKSEGAELEFRIKNEELGIKVFTTRPDTLFGATYMVLAPEHELVRTLKPQIKNWKEVESYIKRSAKKAEVDRIAGGKEKTGVELKGIKAINPANQEAIPVWIADYVLAGYGTGAIMAVPAHDERDFAFAKKFKLPIRQVIEPVLVQTAGSAAFRESEAVQDSHGIIAIIKHWSKNQYLGLRWPDAGWGTFLTGGIDEGMTAEQTVLKEIREETGYKNPIIVRDLGVIHSKYYHAPKKLNRFGHAPTFYVELKNGDRGLVSEEEAAKHEFRWLTIDELKSFLTATSHLQALQLLQSPVYIGSGLLTNSDTFDGMESEAAKWEITKAVGGRRDAQYHLRDWLVSRQRYWGPPIPMIHCEACEAAGSGEQKDMPGWYAVPEKDLPVKLPYVKDFRPKGKGESPLASVRSFYEAKCPKCNRKARRETDVSDAFLDSAWYFLRYPSLNAKNSKLEIRNLKLEIPWNQEITRRWLPVYMYIGGAEHSVLHLLYSRFLTMVFHDWGLLNFEEPFTTFRAHGLITKDGAKMSKSKGNVVNPDEYIRAYGIDAIRMYLAFLAPFEQGGDFRDSGIAGMTRFLNRVWKFFEKPKGQSLKSKKSSASRRITHKTIKKVTEDIEALRYNTAISALMVLLNEFESTPGAVLPSDRRAFLQLLAPFAPYITEELWVTLGGKGSIHVSAWPTFDPAALEEDTFELVVQVNGKVRGRLALSRGATREAAEKAVRAEESLAKHFVGNPKKVIFVPNRLINFVF